MSEQQPDDTAEQRELDPNTSADAWGQPITSKRQAWLQGVLDAWKDPNADHGDRKSPFDVTDFDDVRRRRLRLTGADAFWLAQQIRANRDGERPNLHLEGALLFGARLEHSDLRGAHLEGTDLRSAHLEDALLWHTHLEGAVLEGANLNDADLSQSYLERASLEAATLNGVALLEAHLENTNLTSAHLEGIDLRGAHLEGAVLQDAHLQGADLRDAVLDAATNLKNLTLSDAQYGAVCVADVQWGGANLAVVDWTSLTERNAALGDERAARAWTSGKFFPPGTNPSRQELREAQGRARHSQDQAAARLYDFRAAVRANRQLAMALRDQEMNEEADQFAYRAQVLQRQVFWQQRKRGRAIVSWFFDRMAGHGYRPGRSLAAYLLTLAIFAIAYYLLGPSQGHIFHWDGALIFSLTSFHGRGLFPESLTLENWIIRLAAIEAVFGLLIEITFIATFTQRFFAR